MAEVFLECTHSLTQQVKKKKKKRTKPFGNQEGERDCYLNSIAPKRKENTGGGGCDPNRETGRECVAGHATSVVVLNCKTSSSKRTNIRRGRGMTLLRLLVLGMAGAEEN